jgi:hypothetical protein
MPRDVVHRVLLILDVPCHDIIKIRPALRMASGYFYPIAWPVAGTI